MGVFVFSHWRHQRYPASLFRINIVTFRVLIHLELSPASSSDTVNMFCYNKWRAHGMYFMLLVDRQRHEINYFKPESVAMFGLSSAVPPFGKTNSQQSYTCIGTFVANKILNFACKCRNGQKWQLNYRRYFQVFATIIIKNPTRIRQVYCFTDSLPKYLGIIQSGH